MDLQKCGRRRLPVTLVLLLVAVGASGSTTHSLQTRIGDAIDYRVLATSKTSTMEKELNEAAEAGFRFRAVVEYKLFATTKTSTLQKELLEAGTAGYEIVGMTVSKTALGGKELVAIARRSRVQ